MLAPEARGVYPSLSVEDNLSVRLPRQADRERVCLEAGSAGCDATHVHAVLAGGMGGVPTDRLRVVT